MHRLVYPAAVGGVAHYVWAVKLDAREPTIYALWLAILLIFRIPMWIEQAKRSRSKQRAQ